MTATINNLYITLIDKNFIPNINAASLLDQFQVTKLLSLSLKDFDISLTNSSLIVLLGLSLFIFNYNGLITKELKVSKSQALAENYYMFIYNLVRGNIGSKGVFVFAFIFSLFSFILSLNLLGIIPYVFAVTSHISVTFTLSLSIFLGVTILGFLRHRLNFLSLFFPENSPMILAPLLVFIELLSYTARAISLAIRLSANISSGHLLLSILAGFAFTMLTSGCPALMLVSSLDIVVVFLFTILELAIAVIQSFVFTLLTCIYISDAINLH